MNIFTKLYLPTMFQRSDMDSLLHILKHVLQITKSLKSDNIHKLCLCLKIRTHMSNFKFLACFKADI